MNNLTTDICICNTVSRKMCTIKLVFVILCMVCDKYGGYNISVSWNVMTCSSAKIYGRLGGTPVQHYQTSRRHIPECCVHSHRCRKLQSRTVCGSVTKCPMYVQTNMRPAG